VADDEAILLAIKERQAEVADALFSLQADHGVVCSLDTLTAVAATVDTPRAEYILHHFLEPKGLKAAFIEALRARGVPLAETPPTGPDVLLFSNAAFLGRAQAFRCKIEAGDPVASIGSGCLVSPHLVMTASHVVKSAPPDSERIEPVRVILSDGSSRRVVGPPVYISDCAGVDYAGAWPGDDAPFADLHDIALLRLETAEGAKFGYPELPPPVDPNGPARPRHIMVVHFPEGADIGGVTLGRTKAFRKIRARVGHNAETAAGSSGGPCFSLDCRLVGIHQGRWLDRRRFVPSERFVDAVRPLIEKDVAPPALWSLSETPAGPIVFGRDDLFEAFAEAAGPTSRARGLRLLRADDDTADAMALNFQIVQRLVQLRPGRATLVRVPLSAGDEDVLDVLSQAARAAGVDADLPLAGEGVTPGDTTPEASIRDRAIRFLSALNQAADQSQVWLYFEQDTPLSGLNLVTLEMIVEAAFSQPSIRLVLAGCESVATPGEVFDTPGMAVAAVAAGIIDVPVQAFTAADVRLCLQRAWAALGKPELSAEASNSLVEHVILQGIPPFNARFVLSRYGAVEKRLHDLIWDQAGEEEEAA
jgi:hypothetical protein